MSAYQRAFSMAHLFLFQTHRTTINEDMWTCTGGDIKQIYNMGKYVTNNGLHLSSKNSTIKHNHPEHVQQIMDCIELQHGNIL